MTAQLGTGLNSIFRDMRQSQMGGQDMDQMSHLSIFNNLNKKDKKESRIIGDDASKAYDQID